MDLVAEAGIDVAPWGVRKDGSVIDNPCTNQTYCYEWAFGGDDQPTALCIWHSSLVISQKFILYDSNMRQFALSHESTGFIFDRSSEVRRAVLERAAGVCECCAAPGFKMENGHIFLETHHVIPLSKNGPDEEWNVVAICPNDHRRAHFGEDRTALREQFLAYLSAIYSNAESFLRDNPRADSNATLLS